MQAQTPMLRQYFQAKAEHPDVLLAMRVGDFYEFYGEDAVQATEILDITLTGREDGTNGKIPMAGVPFHSVEKYLARLVQAGKKVALCDQIEDPKQAKGLVRRAVTRVFTPGTLVEDSMLPAGQNNFLAALCIQNGKAGIATLDVSTGEFLVTELGGERWQEDLMRELARIRPAELLAPDPSESLVDSLRNNLGLAVSQQDLPTTDRAARDLMKQFAVSSLDGFGIGDKACGVVAAGMVIGYAQRTCLNLSHVESISSYSSEGWMAIDPGAMRSLELTQNLADGSRKLTLLSVLDTTMTPLGSRRMRKQIERPLLDVEQIRARHDAVGRLVENSLLRADLRACLKGIADLERLVSRCATGYANPRDLALLGRSLAQLPELQEICLPIGFGTIHDRLQQLGDHRALALRLQQAIVPEPPLTLRDGGVIQDGFDFELDALRKLSREGREFIARLEAQERACTGISTLKVGFNSVFGYFLEVGKAHTSKVPEHYIRKQTTANAERYITAELKDQESAVLGAKEKATALEADLFHRLRLEISGSSRTILQAAQAVADFDFLAALAQVASDRAYTRPEMIEEDLFEVESGRHPVVEIHGPAFVPNDAHFERPESESGMRLMVLTGPNMSGKSTYLRQNALIAVMAQMGGFVPARKATLGVCDSVFARIGAKDELAMGHSTFMVEMLESAYILHHATPRSLVVLDEVGRGTSTYDGLAIAWALVERLAEIGAKTLFATHYHQLNVLADEIHSIHNYRVSVQEVGDQVIWTHKVLKGGTDRSYGIHVAKAAGMPPTVLARATEILSELEHREDSPKPVAPKVQKLQLTLFESEEQEVVRTLRNVDVNTMTPVQALALLESLKQQV
ncbi:MAG: DNA mismatch repair protein MutS [Armatimonadetes bacterium]|nr:DNA mismatch repair protein MutS [Armatimonadota bacterium]